MEFQKQFASPVLTLVLFGLSLDSPPFSSEAVAMEVKVSGETRVRGIYSNNLSDGHDHGGLKLCPGEDGLLDESCNDQQAFVDMRFRPKITLSEGDTAGVVVVDLLSQSARDASTLSASVSGDSESGNWRLGSEGFGQGIESLVVREAYLRHTVSWASFVLGRQPVNLGHGLILDDHADGLVMTIPVGSAGITLGNLFLVEKDSPGSSGGDADLYFLHWAWAPNPTMTWGWFMTGLLDRRLDLMLNSPCRNPGDPEDPTAPAGVPPIFQRCSFKDLGDDFVRLFSAGITFDGRMETLALGIEMDLLSGSVRTGNQPLGLNPSARNIKLRGMNALIEADWKLRDMTLGFRGVYGSGQEVSDLPELGGNKLNINAISPNYRLGSILVNQEIDTDRDGGNMGGLKAIRISMKKLYSFNVMGEISVIWAQLTERPAPGIDRDLGWELDFDSTYQISEHVLFVSSIAFLFAGDGWRGIYGDPEARDHPIKLLTKAVYTF